MDDDLDLFSIEGRMRVGSGLNLFSRSDLTRRHDEGVDGHLKVFRRRRRTMNEVHVTISIQCREEEKDYN